MSGHTVAAASAYRLGLDIGGTKTLAVAVDPGGRVVATRRTSTRRGGEGVITTAVGAIDLLLGDTGLSREAEWSVGIGIPGLVDDAEVHHAVNLGIDQDALPLGDVLAGRLGRPVAIENDVKAAALGATALLGPGTAPDLAYLSLGTGLAAGLVLDGRLRRGRHGAAGEIGHLALDPAGAPCPCGQRGCLETAASGSALSAAWPGESSAAQAVFDAADAGDARALAIRAGFAGAVATAVRVLCLTADVEAVVLGGGVAQLGERLREAVAASLRDQAASSPFLSALDLPARLHVVPADFPVAAVGAALLAGLD